MDTKELDNMIPEDERPAMILPSDPEEPADEPVTETRTSDPVADPVSETSDTSAVSDPSPSVETKTDDPETDETPVPESLPAETGLPAADSSAASADASKEDIEKATIADERSHKYLDGKTIVKVIVVPKKIINIVCR